MDGDVRPSGSYPRRQAATAAVVAIGLILGAVTAASGALSPGWILLLGLAVLTGGGVAAAREALRSTAQAADTGNSGEGDVSAIDSQTAPTAERDSHRGWNAMDWLQMQPIARERGREEGRVRARERHAGRIV
jgi:hypothetical protein